MCLVLLNRPADRQDDISVTLVIKLTNIDVQWLLRRVKNYECPVVANAYQLPHVSFFEKLERAMQKLWS